VGHGRRGGAGKGASRVIKVGRHGPACYVIQDSVRAETSVSYRPVMTEHDKRHPEAIIPAGVQRTLELAATWLAWDGLPRLAEDGERLYTPHKAIRRHVDHL